MVKDEERNIRTTLDTVKQFPVVLVYDTGSTDSTVDIVNEYANTRLYSGSFIDFSTSRNAMLEIAERYLDQEYFLLMDAGDQYVEERPIALDDNVVAYMVRQVWHSGIKNTYYNVRLIKKEMRFRYVGRVHEYVDTRSHYSKKMDCFHLYQDRRNSSGSSVKRWEVDRIILEEEVKRTDPSPRDVFYLAQTYECLKMNRRAYDTYKWRTKMDGGFYEERFVSMLRCGDLASTWPKRLTWYMRSFDTINRAEPLIKVAYYYMKCDRFFEAWMFAKMACELTYPKQCNLFVDDDMYTYTRWHILGIVSYYVGKTEDGKRGCEMAIKAKNLAVDLANSKYYA